jgi:hypothetical protein
MRVTQPKIRFSTLKFRTKFMIVGGLVITLALIAFVGWQLFSFSSQNREKQAFTSAMTRAGNFSRNNQPNEAVKVLEDYLKPARPADYRYKAMSSLAYDYIQAKKDDKAYAMLQEVDALRQDPPSIYVLRSLGYYSLIKNDKAKAIAYYTRAVTAAEAKYDPEATPYVAEWKAQLKQLENAK